MKKLVISFVIALSFGSAIAQKSLSFKMQGGAWAGYNFNEKSIFVGLVGPKISTVIEFKKLNIEFGLVGVPGLFFGQKNRLGLVAGPNIIFFKKGKKEKLFLGCMFYKSTTWNPIFGGGITF